MDYLTQDEIKQFLDSIQPNDSNEFRDLVLLSLLYDSAARASELLNIRVMDLNLNNNYKAPEVNDEELKNMIDAISNNSKNDFTLDLFDDLKTLHDNNLKEEIEEVEEPTVANIDKSFYTSSLSFTDDDFEQIKDSIKKNSILTKILFFLLGVIIVTGILLFIYFLIK